MTESPGLAVKRARKHDQYDVFPGLRFVSFIAIGLGIFDLIRGVMHTVFAGYAASEIADVDLVGPSGRDLLTLMIAFGASNLITSAALVTSGLTSRKVSLALLTAIPIAYGFAAVGFTMWSDGLIGQGVFPGKANMRVYLMVCTGTVIAAGVSVVWKSRFQKPQRTPVHAPTE